MPSPGQRQSINFLNPLLPINTSRVRPPLQSSSPTNQTNQQPESHHHLVAPLGAIILRPQRSPTLSSDQTKMRHQKPARQYARPGCCYDKPIVIDDDEQKAITETKTKPISIHTATWLEAKARGRWQSPTTTTAESIFTKKATCFEEQAGERRQGSINRPAVQAGPSQRCRVSTILTPYDVSYSKD